MSTSSLPQCPRCGSIIAGLHSCFHTPSLDPRSKELFYERLYLEKCAEVDELRGRLEAMTGKRDRLRSALERIADESLHIENAPGVCPACMALVALGLEDDAA